MPTDDGGGDYLVRVEPDLVRDASPYTFTSDVPADSRHVRRVKIYVADAWPPAVERAVLDAAKRPRIMPAVATAPVATVDTAGVIDSRPWPLLIGSLIAGVLAGPEGFQPLRPFCEDVFKGVLVLFLLDAGLVAGGRLDALRRAGPRAIIVGIAVPLVAAAMALLTAWMLRLPEGDGFLLMILAASASYIAVPATMKDAIPDADPGLFLPMTIAVTFPFNVCLGIPLYLLAVERVLGG